MSEIRADTLGHQALRWSRRHATGSVDDPRASLFSRHVRGSRLPGVYVFARYARPARRVTPSVRGRPRSTLRHTIEAPVRHQTISEAGTSTDRARPSRAPRTPWPNTSTSRQASRSATAVLCLRAAVSADGVFGATNSSFSSATNGTTVRCPAGQRWGGLGRLPGPPAWPPAHREARPSWRFFTAAKGRPTLA